MKQKLLVSFSGGRTSSYMCWLLKEKYSWIYDLYFVYANTGQEHPKTLEFINNCDLFFKLNLVWIEAVFGDMGVGTTYKVVDYKSASKNGEVFEEMIKKYGIPNMAFPHCTRELKINPLNAYRKDNGFDLQAIGLRAEQLEEQVEHQRECIDWLKSIVEKLSNGCQKGDSDCG